MTGITPNNQVNFSGKTEKQNKSFLLPVSPLADATICGIGAGIASVGMDVYHKGSLANRWANVLKDTYSESPLNKCDNLIKKPTIKENISKGIELLKTKKLNMTMIGSKATIAVLGTFATTYILDKVISSFSNKKKEEV